MGRSIEASTDSICLDLSSQKALYAAAVSRVMDRHSTGVVMLANSRHT